MNILIDNAYLLHFVWGYVKSLIGRFNLKYLVMPVLYLLVSIIVLTPIKSVYNKITYVEYSSYITKYVTMDDKKNYILDKYNLTAEQFRVLCGVVLSEAQSNSYEDAYAVINTIYNRTHAKNWINSVSSKFGNNKGNSLYYQAISPNQFVVYQTGTYLRHINETDTVGYNAIIDFLYEEELMHNYLSFRSHSIKVSGSESFSSNGNNYFNILTNENRV